MVTGSLDINEMSESTISANLRDIIIKCTEFSPNDRYGTMSQLERRLKKISLFGVYLGDCAGLDEMQSGIISTDIIPTYLCICAET